MSTFWLLIALFSAFAYGQWKACGPHVERVVRPGENVTLHCDCTLKDSDIHWVKSCTPLFQAMVISTHESIIAPVPRFSVVLNAVNNTPDLIIENITESDLGIYYCAKVRPIMYTGLEGKLTEDKLYHICNTSMILSYEVHKVHKECECQQCWLVLLTACPVCAILSALLSSVCVFCCCRKSESASEERRPTTSEEQTEDTQVYYASLKIPKGTSRRVRRKTSLNPDFSTYSEVNKGQG